MVIKVKRISLWGLPLLTRAAYIVLQFAAHLVLPMLLAGLLWRARKEPAHLRHLSHRLGLGPVGTPGAVWVYAASLGETRAASPLIRQLRQDGFRVLLSHQTPAGLAEGWRLFPDDSGIIHRYTPVDLFWAVRLLLFRARPVALVILEVELWPAMLIETARRRVPIVMANGNLLERSMGRGGGVGGWLRTRLMSLYKLFSLIFTRDEAYRNRYLCVGVDPGRVKVVGDLKFDQWIDPAHPVIGHLARERWRGAERVLMIASSVKAEEPALMPMVVRLLASDPGLRVLWVPRSPQRFDAVADAISAAGLTVARRSALGPAMAGPMPDTALLVGDSTGEMNVYYAMADLVFVGASLVDHGGHNIMEPLALGRPVVMGPSIYGIAFAAEPAAEAGAFESLPDVDSLEVRIAALLAEPEALSRMSEAARNFAKTRTGASMQTAKGLKALLSEANNRTCLT